LPVGSYSIEAYTVDKKGTFTFSVTAGNSIELLVDVQTGFLSIEIIIDETTNEREIEIIIDFRP